MVLTSHTGVEYIMDVWIHSSLIYVLQDQARFSKKKKLSRFCCNVFLDSLSRDLLVSSRVRMTYNNSASEHRVPAFSAEIPKSRFSELRRTRGNRTRAPPDYTPFCLCRGPSVNTEHIKRSTYVCPNLSSFRV